MFHDFQELRNPAISEPIKPTSSTIPQSHRILSTAHMLGLVLKTCELRIQHSLTPQKQKCSMRHSFQVHPGTVFFPSPWLDYPGCGKKRITKVDWKGKTTVPNLLRSHWIKLKWCWHIFIYTDIGCISQNIPWLFSDEPPAIWPLADHAGGKKHMAAGGASGKPIHFTLVLVTQEPQLSLLKL